MLFVRVPPGHEPEIVGKKRVQAVRCYDELLDRRLEVPADLVVLSVGMRPRQPETDNFHEMLKASVGLDGFFLERHPELAPVETAVEAMKLGAREFLTKPVRLKELDRLKDEFISTVTHELRTPLTSIKAFVETLLDGELRDRKHSIEFLEITRKHVERMEALIDDLTDLSLIETLDDGAVTIRERDSLQQERVPIDRVEEIVTTEVDMKQLLK